MNLIEYHSPSHRPFQKKIRHVPIKNQDFFVIVLALKKKSLVGSRLNYVKINSEFKQRSKFTSGTSQIIFK